MTVLPSLQNIKVERLQKGADESHNYNINEEQTIAKKVAIEELKDAIQAYANQAKAHDRMFEFVLFNEREIRYSDQSIVFLLQNEVQQAQLNDYKGQFVNYLKAKFEINFTIGSEMLESTLESKKLLYTPTDKYKFLAEKYPVLEELKKRLGLELEF